jgi:nitrate reductase (NAD(P)H)
MMSRGGSKYGTSVTREWALDPSRDIMLAYMQNGEPLLPDHGFPVRVIIPGCIGGRMVKWLKRIIVTPAESDNYYHYKDNRVLPSHIDAELANAEGNSCLLTPIALEHLSAKHG